MENLEKEKVPFDPGYSDLVGMFPREAYSLLEQIASLKQNHQKKFAFTNLENQLVPIIKTLASFYLGCLLWASYLYYNFKDDNREIADNPIFELSEQEKAEIDSDKEIDFIVGFIEKFEKSAKYYLNRKSKIDSEWLKYFEIYKTFSELNSDFKNLRCTEQIKLPKEFIHIENKSKMDLENLRDVIYKAIKAEKIELLLDIGFYK
jgi:hypothetical protein